MHKLNQVGRSTPWRLVGRLPLDFPTFHPQGLAFAGGKTFLSSVEILELPEAVELGPGGRTPGRGVGHVFVMDPEGAVLHDLVIGEGDMYHPGGIDFDGTSVWVPVAEYRGKSSSIIQTIDPASLEVKERFRVQDHIGWLVSDPLRGVLYGGSWGSRDFYTWSPDGVELDRWQNPCGFIDYQDCQHAGDGVILCSGISALPQAGGDVEYELGGIALVDVRHHRILHETPVPLFSAAGHVVTRNPFAMSTADDGLVLWVAPDDGDEGGGTEILKYEVTF
ncbi:MAG: DUF6454 family protein [Actinomycetota bacterium]|nr:DUF6454 family protein [Actinomycetota bacterium]